MENNIVMIFYFNFTDPLNSFKNSLLFFFFFFLIYLPWNYSPKGYIPILFDPKMNNLLLLILKKSNNSNAEFRSMPTEK